MKVRKVVTGMLSMSAVVFIPDDSLKTGADVPTMLSPVQGAPVLAWLADAMFAGGVGRFFLVCGHRWAQAAAECFPRDAQVSMAQDSAPGDLLHVFLSTAEEAEQEVTIVTGPAAYLPLTGSPTGRHTGVCTASREALMEALDENFSFPQFLRENCTFMSDHDGFFPMESPAAAQAMGRLLQRERNLRLSREGVGIYDPESCYIEPTVVVEPGAELLPGTLLRGKTVIHTGAVIGPWSTVEDSVVGCDALVRSSWVSGSQLGPLVQVGPYAHLRPGSVLDRGARIGNFVEVKNAHVGENTLASHLSYVGDADVGREVNLGCGTVTVNFDRVEKHRTTVEDSAFVGCHSALVAPVKVGRGAYVAAGSVISEDVPEEALAIGRAKQVNKRDWAAKHKK